MTAVASTQSECRIHKVCQSKPRGNPKYENLPKNKPKLNMSSLKKLTKPKWLKLKLVRRKASHKLEASI